MLDGTQTDFVKQKANEEISLPKLVTVVAVYEHLAEGDDSNFECDILVDGQLFEDRSIPYHGTKGDAIAPPIVGDTVLMISRDGENRRPILLGTGYTNRDRAPLARAGMSREVYESQSSPSGDGNISVTGYTKYSENPAVKDKSTISPEKAWYQIAKEVPTPDPVDSDTASMAIEMFDSGVDGEEESHIRLTGNEVDGDDTKSIDVKLDFKEGNIKISAEDSGDEAGILFDVNDGSFKLLDNQGYGIESNGSGNFTWHHDTIDMSEGTTTSL